MKFGVEPSFVFRTQSFVSRTELCLKNACLLEQKWVGNATELTSVSLLRPLAPVNFWMSSNLYFENSSHVNS